MSKKGGVAGIAAAVLVIALVSLPASADGRVQGYGLFWEGDIRGYGGFACWAGDVNGDGVNELIVQAIPGEQEGGPPIPADLAVYRRFTEIYRGTLEAGDPVAAAVDFDGDGRLELVTRGGKVLAWSDDQETLLVDTARREALDRWLQDNFLPEMTWDVMLLDFDGDGTVDRVQQVEQTLVLESKTRGQIVLDLSEVRGSYLGGVSAVDLGGQYPALFTQGYDFRTPGSTRLLWSLWLRGPGDTYVRAEGVPDPASLTVANRRFPVAAFIDIDSNGVDELVTNSGGVILAYQWTEAGFVELWRSPDNGGLGYPSFVGADMNGNGIPELVAQHTSPTVYQQNLKIYEWRSGSMEGIADVFNIGPYEGPTPFVADLLGLGTEQVIIGRDFESARPNALGLNIDLANLPPPVFDGDGGTSLLVKAGGAALVAVAVLGVVLAVARGRGGRSRRV
ncbi:MAG: hypothetical protein C4551_06105 [Bacillota bacterium]|nr:MAG: hypothetical protein C4551_06105 [Bacillota bacterium]